MRRILVVGFGNMGQALVRGWLELPDLQHWKILALDPAPAAREAAGELGITSLAGSAVLPASVDILVCAVKPQMATEVLSQLHTKAELCISIMAGTSLDTLTNLVKADGYVRVMPNTPAQVGAGFSGYVLGPGADNEETENIVQTLLYAVGDCMRVGSEEELDKITAITGSGPGYVMEIAKAMVAAAQSLGFSEEQSERMVASTLAGAGVWMAEDGNSPVVLRDRVTSKGGTTAAGLQELQKADLETYMTNTYAAAYKRARELAQETD